MPFDIKPTLKLPESTPQWFWAFVALAATIGCILWASPELRRWLSERDPFVIGRKSAIATQVARRIYLNEWIEGDLATESKDQADIIVARYDNTTTVRHAGWETSNEEVRALFSLTKPSRPQVAPREAKVATVENKKSVSVDGKVWPELADDIKLYHATEDGDVVAVFTVRGKSAVVKNGEVVSEWYDEIPFLSYRPCPNLPLSATWSCIYGLGRVENNCFLFDRGKKWAIIHLTNPRR